MLSTELPSLTFYTLIAQALLLFTQVLFYLSRPRDSSRLRFVILIFAYMVHNYAVARFPDPTLFLSGLIQNTITYLSGLLLGVYFLYCTYMEFQIRTFGFLQTRNIFYSLGTAFFMLFFVPYYVSGEFEFSRRLYLSVVSFMALVILINTFQKLIDIYNTSDYPGHSLFHYKLMAFGFTVLTLCAMPFTYLFGDYQTLEQVVVNAGFFALTLVHLVGSILNAQMETQLIDALTGEVLIDPPSTLGQQKRYKMNIPDQTVKDILEQLWAFEKEKIYLQPKWSTGKLADQCGTNSRYLSQVINQEKGKNFQEYINDLRINYAKERLKNDVKFLNFTQKAMANEIGYVSAEQFSKVFYRKEKVKLSAYIEYLRENY